MIGKYYFFKQKMIKFLVNGKIFEISLENIENFPDTFIELLVRNYTNKTFYIKTENNAIVIEKNCKYFDKIVLIYENPKIVLTELLDLNSEILIKQNFKNFMKELKYFGFEKSVDLDQNTIICNIKENLYNKIRNVDKRGFIVTKNDSCIQFPSTEKLK